MLLFTLCILIGVNAFGNFQIDICSDHKMSDILCFRRWARKKVSDFLVSVLSVVVFSYHTHFLFWFRDSCVCASRLPSKKKTYYFCSQDLHLPITTAFACGYRRPLASNTPECNLNPTAVALLYSDEKSCPISKLVSKPVRKIRIASSPYEWLVLSKGEYQTSQQWWPQENPAQILFNGSSFM